MRQTRDRGAEDLRLGVVAMLLLARLASGADPIQSSGVEAIAGPARSLNEEIDAPALPRTPPPPWSGDIWQRSQLAGDWFGSRNKLAENGLSFFADLTQYYQGVTTGGLAQQFKYGGRGDYLIDIDTAKAGLWQGGHLDLRGETRLGQDCNEIDGAFALSNFAMALPTRPAPHRAGPPRRHQGQAVVLIQRMREPNAGATQQVQSPPRAVAISGIIFSVLYIASLVLIRLAVPADPTEPGSWLADPAFRNWVRIALNLVPFTGIAFLWFMAVLRNRIGLLEDRFFATVFLGSGLLFVAMLFAAVSVSRGLLDTFAAGLPGQSEAYRLGRGMAYALMNTFGMRMAAVFMFVTSTIGLRTAVLARWVSFVGFACGLVLLLVITDFAWIALLFPLWVLLVSSYILYSDLQEGHKIVARTGPLPPDHGADGDGLERGHDQRSIVRSGPAWQEIQNHRKPDPPLWPADPVSRIQRGRNSMVLGKSLREKCPRQDDGVWQPSQLRPNPVSHKRHKRLTSNASIPDNRGERQDAGRRNRAGRHCFW